MSTSTRWPDSQPRLWARCKRLVDHAVERAETRALGRALAAPGIGTQFMGQDLTEGEHVADAPVATPNGHPGPIDMPPAEAGVPDFPPPTAEAPVPAVVPAGLPCAGQAVTALTPAQLRTLLSRVDQLAADQGCRWRPLLEGLAAERQRRVEAGRKRPVLVPVEGDGHG